MLYMIQKNTSTLPAGRLRLSDILLLAVFLLIALALFVGYRLFHADPGSAIEISIDGKTDKVLPLGKNTKYDITPKGGGKNILEIRDGYASIIEADCPDKLCVSQKKINKNGETLVCLPHKVIVTVISSPEEREFDGIAN